MTVATGCWNDTPGISEHTCAIVACINILQNGEKLEGFTAPDIPTQNINTNGQLNKHTKFQTSFATVPTL